MPLSPEDIDNPRREAENGMCFVTRCGPCGELPVTACSIRAVAEASQDQEADGGTSVGGCFADLLVAHVTAVDVDEDVDELFAHHRP